MSSSRLAETARPPSEYTAVAENVRLVPLVILAAEVDVAIDVSLGADEPGDPAQPAKRGKTLAVRTSNGLDIFSRRVSE
jgi:hypothetical protein